MDNSHRALGYGSTNPEADISRICIRRENGRNELCFLRNQSFRGPKSRSFCLGRERGGPGGEANLIEATTKRPF